MEAEHAARRRDGRTRDTRERIHAIALELFISQGFAHTTMQDIADRLGLTKAALYYHFPTKQDLVRSVVQPTIDQLNGFVAELRAHPVPPRELLERFFDLNYANRRVGLALTLDPSGLADIDSDNVIPRLADAFQEVLLGPTATNDRRVRVVMMANGLSRAATLLTDIPYDELKVSAVNAALHTIGSSP